MPMRVVIADYHALLRDGLGMIVKDLAPDVEVVHCDDFERLWPLIDGGRIDLVLLDFNLPNFSGAAALRDLTTQYPAVPIVIMAGSERWADACNVIEAGARGYIPKSASSVIMLAALRLILSGGTYIPPLMNQASGAARAAGGLPRFGDGGDDLPLHKLTPRQMEVLRCLARGQSNKEIAYQLGLSQGTVKIHIAAIFKAFKVRNRTQAVIAAGLRN